MSAPPDTAHRHEATVALACACVAALIAALMLPGTRDFALDDAWIHLDYARSLRGGDGPSYNPGDYETGFSSPLWVLLLAVWPIAGHPVLPVKLLGVLLHAAAAWLGALIVLELGRERADDQRPIPLAAMTGLGGVLVAVVPTSVHAATSGMEVPLATAVLLGALLHVLRGQVVPAAVLGACAVLSRPELLATVFLFATAMAWAHRRARSPLSASRLQAGLAAAGGAAFALAAWVAYAWVVSGYPWPNAQYIKGVGGGLAGLTYLTEEVLPWQPWLVGLAPVALLYVALRSDARRGLISAAALVAAGLGTWVAIALSRPLHPGVEFFEARYFAIVSPLFVLPLPWAVALGLGHARRSLRVATLLSLLPLAGLCGLQIWQLRVKLVDASEDTFALHSAPAQALAETLPPTAVVGVEGAGASRFFTPRSMRIVDIVGLNNKAAAHTHFDRPAKICTFVREDLTHLLLPSDWAPAFAEAFELRPSQVWRDDRYTQVRPPTPRAVVLFEVIAVRQPWAERCR